MDIFVNKLAHEHTADWHTLYYDLDWMDKGKKLIRIGVVHRCSQSAGWFISRYSSSSLSRLVPVSSTIPQRVSQPHVIVTLFATSRWTFTHHWAHAIDDSDSPYYPYYWFEQVSALALKLTVWSWWKVWIWSLDQWLTGPGLHLIIDRDW